LGVGARLDRKALPGPSGVDDVAVGTLQDVEEAAAARAVATETDGSTGEAARDGERRETVILRGVDSGVFAIAEIPRVGEDVGRVIGACLQHGAGGRTRNRDAALGLDGGG